MKTKLLMLVMLLPSISFAAEPVIKSATTSVSNLKEGGTFTLTVIAESDTPVAWLNSIFDGPSGNIHGGGTSATFQQTATNEWTYSRSFSISAWAASGDYRFTSLSVQNESREVSANYVGPTVHVENSKVASIPVIKAVNSSTAYLQDGGTFTLEVVAESNAPVTSLNLSFNSPNGNIFGGGRGVTFESKGNNIWVYTTTHTISKWAPSGTYSFSGISVQNEGQLSSTEYRNPPTVFVNNTEQASQPVIISVTVSPSVLPSTGGNFELTVTAKSNAPTSWLDVILDGPTGNIEGGGSGVQFTEISKGVWQYKRIFTIPALSPHGDYVFTFLSVRNDNQLSSNDWRGKPTVSKH